MPPKKKSFTYPYPRPSVTVDLVAFTFRDAEMHVLMVKRKAPPFAGMYAFPGGFLDLDEEVEAAVARETREETGLTISGPILEMGFYGEVGRDPRGRTISLVHTALIRPPTPDPVGGDDAADASWIRLADLMTYGLAFDHAIILADAVDWIESVCDTNHRAIMAFLPECFGEADVKKLLKYFGIPSSEADNFCRDAIDDGYCERLPGRKKQYRSHFEATELIREDLTE